ncbi:type II toxin-antitoxin system RelE/ParE family toxin [Leucothrix mucor]|uniref:type II toxin-antitoxin system RelE/ParE family toxin n=1 Tax=Leucothrix mucor TaxID=45248 RepID=UPI0003B3F11A|nr:type II toxin-antitoxin system RelE/ParE family toxin [Leucothrix mucor]
MGYSIRYTAEAASDLRKLTTFEVQNTGESKGIDYLRLMLENLADNPNIGTQYEEHFGVRQIHVPYGKSGYSALYKVHDVIEIVGILRIKHQRQNTYS